MQRTVNELALAELVKLRALRTDTAILLMVGDSTDLGLIEVADKLALEKNTVSMAAARLKQSGDIYFAQPLSDLRKIIFRLTPEGAEHARSVRIALFEVGKH